MKRIICAMMLLGGITSTAFAQEVTKSNSDKTFDLPSNFAKRKFTVDLGRGNKMIIEIDHVGDLDRFINIDSILNAYLKDMEPFKDSLSDELNSKRIDYIIDSTPVRKIRIQQYQPKGSSFAVTDSQVSALKLEQDTIHLSGKVVFYPKYTLRKRFRDVRSYRVTFLLNNLNDLNGYINGSLNEKVLVLRNNVTKQWEYRNNQYTLQADPSISANVAHGFVAGGNYLNFRVSVDVQNYKSYFVPSFSLGAGLIISSNGYFKRDVILSWDPHFFFDKNDQGQLRTFRNDFLTLTYGQGPIRDNEPRKESHLLAIVSLGYLVHRSGEYYDDHTFRLGMGRLSLFEGKSKIEPVIYFNNFFKGVTPGLRWIQSF